SAAFLPQSVVSQIYLGNIGGLTHPEITLFNSGIAQSILVLGIIDLIAIVPIILVILQQRKSF
ncbi:MAG: hypothetical protein ACRECH_12090, partial [Nitrososphaerales archaeon]